VATQSLHSFASIGFNRRKCAITKRTGQAQSGFVDDRRKSYVLIALAGRGSPPYWATVWLKCCKPNRKVALNGAPSSREIQPLKARFEYLLKKANLERPRLPFYARDGLAH